MKAKKPAVKRKRWATEFLIRSENPKLVEQLDKIAKPQRLSVNSLVLNKLDEVIKAGK